MTTQILIAGFGGQGILFSGKLLAYKALSENKELSWLPSYGPEMRGGTASCSVTISDEPVGSPIIDHPDVLIVMNLPSLDKYPPWGRYTASHRQESPPPPSLPTEQTLPPQEE